MSASEPRRWSLLLSPLVAPGEELSPFAPAAYAVGTREEVLAKADAWMRERERELDEAAGVVAGQEDAT